MVITPGQTSDYVPAEALIEGRAGEAVIADRGYDADRVIGLIERQGSKTAAPTRAPSTPGAHPISTGHPAQP